MPSFKSYNRILDEHLHTLIAQGNHEAYLRLKKRYHRYADGLIRDILTKFPGTGISFDELISLCDNQFSLIVKRYNPELSSFFTYWKEICEQVVMDYLVENSYLGSAKEFFGFINLDDELDERKIVGEQIRENNDTLLIEKRRNELKVVIRHNREAFKKREFALLNLLLDGYSIVELEHADLISRSSLYLTCNTAIKKLERIIFESQKK